jgi:uncharacterized LabA/DUF88 family protein
MKRVTVFWDFSNFNSALKRGLDAIGGPNTYHFAFEDFVARLTGGMDLIRVYFACSSRSADDPVKALFHHVDNLPHFYLQSFERRKSGEEKQVDVYLAAQMVAQAYENSYDVAILVSGDEDYVPAIEIAQHKGKLVFVASMPEALSTTLKKKADRIISLGVDGSAAIDLTAFIEAKERALAQ